ncbi:hypothetical protein QE422_003268 [Chryseobacterium sp. SORGH_AS 447]|uniref:hypothetical protein n=1 Tax=Chryseobacterium sp. SORGH_AS_0447 TaxID=3041769 RepID=UPI00277ECDAF|nr:hypothetical protein [Chryseobacterium sp. SORGH_AS_0447]MDQ1162900.1 hypothetical protein [Chryseobacterium sp. SORGH_AS_0447]
MKKIFYVPGMISALLIPVLVWFYITPYIDQTVYNIIDIGLPAKVAKNKSNINSTFEPFRNWHYKKINVYPSTAKKNSLSFVSELKSLQKKNQKETGIEFVLGKNNTYGDFISLLNDMAIAQQNTYALDLEKTGHLFAVVNYSDPKREKFEYECLLCHDIIYEVSEPSFWDKFSGMRYYYQTVFENLSKLPKGAYYIISGFLLFLNISMFSIKANLQVRRKVV